MGAGAGLILPEGPLPRSRNHTQNSKPPHAFDVPGKEDWGHVRDHVLLVLHAWSRNRPASTTTSGIWHGSCGSSRQLPISAIKGSTRDLFSQSVISSQHYHQYIESRQVNMRKEIRNRHGAKEGFRPKSAPSGNLTGGPAAQEES